MWMAKTKKVGSTDVDDDHVAVKIMKDDGYATREISILSELTANYPHPNIVRLLHDLKSKGGTGAKYCEVLSLARGPTLNYILSKFGGLGLVIAQSISCQLIDAVAFLHGHAGEYVFHLQIFSM